MPPRARSVSRIDAVSRAGQRRRTVLASLAAALPALAALAVASCTESEWPDRDPLVIERAPVDSLEFLPPGSRYQLADSLSRVRVAGYRKGYACTRLPAFDLEEMAFNDPPGWAARIRMELPERPTCPIDTGSRDSVLLRRFAASDGPAVRLLDSLGAVLDTARLVRGTLRADSLVVAAPALSAFKGRFFFRDTVGSLPRLLSADSLGSCEFLNHAEYARHGDTATVRFTWVTLDPSSDPDACLGPAHGDTLTPLPARP